MEMTVLGNNGAYPGPGAACSGYLLTEGDTNVLIDCGSGVVSNLQKHIGIEKLDALILTHLHSDHASDVILLGHAVGLMMARGIREKILCLYAPDQPSSEYTRLGIKDIIELHPITGDLLLKIGDMAFTFGLMNHPMINYGISVESGGKRFTYSGDTGWDERILEFFKDSDMLVLDSGMRAKDKTGPDAPHMTAAECGMAAKRVGAKRMLLSHFKPYHDIRELQKEASEYYPNVEVTVMHKTYKI